MKWKEYSLDELINIKHGYAFKGEFFSEEPTDDILLTPGNFAIGGGFKAQKLKYYNGDFPVDYILDENDVIVTMTDLSKEADTLGFSAKVPAWYGKRFLHNQRIGLVKLKTDDFDKDYLYWLMRTFSYQRFVANGATGATVKHTSPTKICQYKFTAPDDKTTQRKIASILSAYDDLIENNLKRIKLLEEAINLNFKDLISKEDKNFTYIKLNSFVDIISGFPFKSNYYNENGKHKIVTIKNVQDGFFVPIVTDRIDDVPDNMNKALFLTTGDVIMSLTGNVGRVCLVYGDDYVLNQRVVKLSAKEQIDQPFIYALVRDKQMLKILENLSNGAAQQNLSPIKMGELPIRYPNKSLREDFNQKVSPMLEMICKLNIQNTKLREARDILLPKLMNGQIEV
jgi:type I restriction enzyme S subunit